MRKLIIGFIIGSIVSFSTVAYGSNPLQELLFSANFIFNGKPAKLGTEYSVINLNGHVYVPIRFVTENLAAIAIKYNEDTRTIHVDQSSIKLDESISAPIPFVAYENKNLNGNIWIQELPLLQGSSCWKGCIESPRPIAEFVKQTGYPPVIVNKESTIIIKYPMV